MAKSILHFCEITRHRCVMQPRAGPYSLNPFPKLGNRARARPRSAGLLPPRTHSCPRQILRNQKNGEVLVWSHPLIFPPRHERPGVREHTRPACRFDQLSCVRAGQASTSEDLHARGTFAEPSSTQARRLLYCVAASAGGAQTTPHVRRQNLISKGHSRALPRRFNSRSSAQPTVILDSSAKGHAAR